MKIGILTFHRAYNYGAVLQCYALMHFLMELGHEVYIIDYRQPWTECLRKTISWGKIKQLYKHPKALLSYMCFFLNRNKANKNSEIKFNSFVNKYLKLKDTCHGIKDFPQHYDCYVIGSDQLWGKSCLGGKFDRIYMGDFPHNKKSTIVGYAISSTEKSIYDLDKTKLHKVLNNFSELSFREQNVANLTGFICNKKFPVCVDPTLLSDSSVWKCLIDEKWKDKNYILIYEAREAVKYPNLLYSKAKKMKELTGKDYEIIDMSGMVYSVSDFVSAFKYAKCVITTSFHATVFSIIFNRPFYAIKLGDGADGRYVNLLNQLDLTSQCVEPDFEPMLPTIDFSEIENKLALYRKSSIEFLNIALS